MIIKTIYINEFFDETYFFNMIIVNYSQYFCFEVCRTSDTLNEASMITYCESIKVIGGIMTYP